MSVGETQFREVEEMIFGVVGLPVLVGHRGGHLVGR